MSARRFLFVLAFFALTAAASAQQTPKGLFEGAVAELEAGKTGDNKLDKQIAKIIKAVNRSLFDKGESLFIDGTRIVPPPRGRKVFRNEAVGLLLKQIEKAKVPLDVLELFRRVIDDVVLADQTIADLSLATARALLATGQGDPKRIETAGEAFDRATQAAAAGDL